MLSIRSWWLWALAVTLVTSVILHPLEAGAVSTSQIAHAARPSNSDPESQFVYETAPFWIWSQSTADIIYFRKTFQISAAPTSASLTLTADGNFKLFINGTFVGQNQDWTDVKTVDIANYVTAGTNIIAVEVDKKRADRGLIISGKLSFPNSPSLELMTDESWQTFDQTTAGWMNLGFDDSNWPKAIFQAEIDDSAWPGTMQRFGYTPPPPPRPKPVDNTANNLRVKQLLGQAYTDFLAQNQTPTIISPTSYYVCNKNIATVNDIADCLHQTYTGGISAISPLVDKTLIVDLGRETFGQIQLTAAALRQGSVEVFAGEDLAQLFNSTLSDHQAYNLTTANFTEDRNRALRYLGLRFSSAVTPTNLQVALLFHGYPVVNKGYFESSDPILNQIWRTAAYTVRVDMQKYYWDGIRHDRALWLGDFLEEAKTNYYTFGDLSLAKKSLLNLAAHLGTEGQVRSQIGIGNAQWNFPDYIAKWVTVLKDYYTFSGDLAFVQSLKGVIVNQLNYLNSRVDTNGLVNLAYDPTFPVFDWSSSSRHGEVAYQQMVYYKALLDGASLMKAIGDQSTSERYLRQADGVRNATMSRLFDNQRGVFRDERIGDLESNSVPQDANVLSIVYGLIKPQVQIQQVLDYLTTHHWTASGSKLIDPPYFPDALKTSVRNSISPTMNSYEAQARFKNGQDNQALDLIKRAYEGMVSGSSGTFWEFKGLNNQPESASSSLAHGWSGNVAYVMSQDILGITPTGPGFETFTFSPHLGSLGWVKGAVPTPRGLIGVEITRDPRDLGFTIHLITPPGVNAQIMLPQHEKITQFDLDSTTTNSKRHRSFHRTTFTQRVSISTTSNSFTIPGGADCHIKIKTPLGS